MSYVKRTKKRVEKLLHSKKMLYGITLASFLEATVVPIPLETILVPLMQARRDRIWLIALVTLLGCMLGAMVGYFIGYFLFDILRDIVMVYVTTEEQFAEFQKQMDTHGFWFVFSTGVTPIPLQIAMLMAGLSGYSLFLYMLAVTSSRFIRYFSLALLVYLFGNKTEKIIKRYKWQSMAIILAAIAMIVLYKMSSA